MVGFTLKNTLSDHGSVARGVSRTNAEQYLTFIVEMLKIERDVAGAKNTDVDSVAVRWVQWIYIPLILLVIGAMFLHNAIIWRFKARARRRMANPYMTRMTVRQRWQHDPAGQFHRAGHHRLCAQVP